jgi:four helix bundle protein
MSDEEKMSKENERQIKGHKDLEVWKKGIDFVESIYKVTAQFPKEEIYGLTSQMRRAAVSIPSNIAEGAARNGKKEFVQFLYIALGSLSELETQIIIAKRLAYFHDIDSLLLECSTIKKLLNGLIISLTKNIH